MVQLVKPNVLGVSLASVVVVGALLAGCTGEPAGEPNGAEASAGGVRVEGLTVTEDLDLEGDLRLPAEGKPAATVVIIAGSGPQSRDGELSGQLGLTFPEPVPVYRELAEGLAEQGYGAATWDKRTCGSFNDCADNAYPGPSGDLTFDDLVDDATAVVHAVAQRDDLGELVVLGHSQGGTIAAQVARATQAVDGLIMVATPQPAIGDVLRAQADTLRDLLAELGQSGPQAKKAVSQVQTIADGVRQVADGKVDGPSIDGVPRSFWAGWIDASREAPEDVAALDLPVLVVGGENDWNVLPAQVKAWKRHLGQDDDLVMLPGVTHALTHLATDDVASITPSDVGTELDPSVLETISAWLDSALR